MLQGIQRGIEMQLVELLGSVRQPCREILTRSDGSIGAGTGGLQLQLRNYCSPYQPGCSTATQTYKRVQ